MNVIVRLYWQHDLDLVALTLHPMFEMGKWMKKAMIAYAQGDEEFHIPLPPEMPLEKPLENSDAHFALDPKNEIENEVIKILQQFRNGQRNSVIKLIFRNYLDELFLKPYIDTNTYIVKARGNYGGKKKENNISIPSVTKRTAKYEQADQSRHDNHIANVLAYIILFPFQPNEFKHDISPPRSASRSSPPAFQISFQCSQLQYHSEPVFSSTAG